MGEKGWVLHIIHSAWMAVDRGSASSGGGGVVADDDGNDGFELSFK